MCQIFRNNTSNVNNKGVMNIQCSLFTQLYIESGPPTMLYLPPLTVSFSLAPSTYLAKFLLNRTFRQNYVKGMKSYLCYVNR